MTIMLLALACIPLVLVASAAGSFLRREISLWRWRHGHPALIPLRLAIDEKKTPRTA